MANYDREKMRLYMREYRARRRADRQAEAAQAQERTFASNLGIWSGAPAEAAPGEAGSAAPLLDLVPVASAPAARRIEPEAAAPVLDASSKYAGRTEAEIIREWAAAKLKIPSGPRMGKPFEIDDFQFEFLQAALRPEIKMAALSVARKNGKSGLLSVACLARLAGPLNRRDWRGVVVSETGNLAKELRRAMEMTADISGLGGLVFHKSPPPGQVFGLNDAHLAILAADKATGHSIGSDWAIIDEAGLLGENKRELWNAIVSSAGSRDGKLICISIRGDGPMFSELHKQRHLPSVVWHEYAGDPELPFDDPANWELANPGLKSGIKSLGYMQDRAAYVAANSADQPSFAAHDLNLPQSPTREMICSLNDWQSCELPDEAELPARNGRCWLGVDIGGSSSMTAAVAAWSTEDGIRIEVRGAFPAEPTLKQRGAADAVGGLYERMRERGELLVTPGRVTDVEMFLLELNRWLAGEQVFMLADRFRRAEVMTAMTKAGLNWPVEWRGQGHSHTADGSADVRGFQAAVMTGSLRFKKSLMMDAAVGNSSIVRDSAGNPKLQRLSSRGRIDALQAGVMSIAACYAAAGIPRRGVYHGLAG